MIRSCSDVTLSLLDINCLIYSFSDGITILCCQALFTNFEFTHKWRDSHQSLKQKYYDSVRKKNNYTVNIQGGECYIRTRTC